MNSKNNTFYLKKINKSQLIFKNENNARTSNRNIQNPIVLELDYAEWNMFDMWVSKPNVMIDPHIFLGIIPDEIHRLNFDDLDESWTLFSFLLFFLFSQNPNAFSKSVTWSNSIYTLINYQN